MSIYLKSRYANERVARVLGTGGERKPTIFRAPPADWRFSYDPHLVVEGDRLDMLAERAYGDPELWWVLAEANPELDAPEPLTPGTTLRIPRAR